MKSCGKPIVNVEVRVVDEEGMAITPGAVGKIIVRYKKPKSVEFVHALPRNATGKVLKTVLRLEFTPA